jgi:hypothetical protein
MKDLLHQIKIATLKEAIEKRAGFWSSFTRSLSSTNMGKQVGEGLLAAGAAAAVTGLGVAAKAGIDALRDRVEKPRLFKEMLAASPGLQKKDPRAVQMTFNTLYGMNRQMARDPLVAGSFVGKTVERAEISGEAGAYVDPQTAKMLMDVGPRRDGPIMEAWKGGPSQAQLYKTMGDKRASADKLSLFKKQLSRRE